MGNNTYSLVHKGIRHNKGYYVQVYHYLLVCIAEAIKAWMISGYIEFHCV
jgi:hypothetical protein